MKTLFKNITLLILLGLSILSCTPPPVPAPPPVGCSTIGTDFQNIFTTFLASNPLYDDYTTMDLVTHEYTFKMLTNKTICSIGYQGNANLFAANIPYTIEIYDVTSSTLYYTGNHVFDSATTDYQATVTPIPTLLAGHEYTIRRIASNYLGDITNTIGRIGRINSGALPSGTTLTGSVMKIKSSNFYGTGGPIPNYGIPYIDIAFQ